MKDSFVTIVDYDLGNLFSIQQACKKVGLNAIVTCLPEEISVSSAVILAGVGAFGKAMATLASKGLVDVLRNYARSGRPIMGICLGMQLLMSRSEEFGNHLGLDIVKGQVLQLKTSVCEERFLKIPHIDWNNIYWRQDGPDSVDSWKGTLLEEIPNNARMYFVHSYFVEPEDRGIVISSTRYGNNEFCSSLHHDNIWAFQFHPECSGHYGLKIYENLAKILK